MRSLRLISDRTASQLHSHTLLFTHNKIPFTAWGDHVTAAISTRLHSIQLSSVWIGSTIYTLIRYAQIQTSVLHRQHRALPLHPSIAHSNSLLLFHSNLSFSNPLNGNDSLGSPSRRQNDMERNNGIPLSITYCFAIIIAFQHFTIPYALHLFTSILSVPFTSDHFSGVFEKWANSPSTTYNTIWTIRFYLLDTRTSSITDITLSNTHYSISTPFILCQLLRF